MAASALILTACGGGSSEEGGEGGKLAIFVGAQPNFPDQFKTWSTEITAAFKAATGADLTIETFASAADETTKIQASVVSGTGPDVYQLGTTFTPVAYGTKGFAALSDADWNTIGGKDKFIPATLGMSGPDAANLIGVPVAMRPFVMVYNKELLAAAGITAPPTTWDGLVDAAKKLTKPGVYGLAVDYADGFSPWKYIWSLAEQSGTPVVSKDNKKAQLNTPQVLQATQNYFDLLVKHKVVDPDSVSWKSGDAIAAFAGGKAAILTMGSPAVIPTLKTSSVEGKYAFAPMPSVPFGATSLPSGANPAQTIVSGDNIAVASYTKNKALALEFVKLTTSKEFQIKQYQYFGNLPTTTEAYDELAKSNPVLAPFAEAEKGATPTAFTGAWADVQTGIQNVVVQSLPSLAKGSYDANAIQALLKEANDKAQSSLDRASR